MNIGNVQLDGNILLAPIAGFSDVGFRHLCAKYGASLTYTELVSAKGLVYGSRGTEELLATTEQCSPCAVQLFGGDPEFIYRAAADDRLKRFDIIDINMGCPVKKVFNNGEGSALMLKPELISEIVAAAREGSKKPVTVKLRAGVEEGRPFAVACAVAAERGGASAITVHPRYRSQFYSGRADHLITRAVKEAVSVPVIANGDIVDIDSLEEVKRISGADGFMIARGALGRPYIFSELVGREYDFSALEAIREHVEILQRYLPDQIVANQMKLHLCFYAKGKPYAKAVRVAVGEVKNVGQLLAVTEEYFK